MNHLFLRCLAAFALLMPSESSATLLRYAAQVGDQFSTEVSIAGTIVTTPPGGERFQMGVSYSAVLIQTVEEVSHEGIIRVRIEVVPETLTTSGSYDRLSGGHRPEATVVRMTTSGEIIKVRGGSPSEIAWREVSLADLVGGPFLQFPEHDIGVGERWESRLEHGASGAVERSELLSIRQINGHRSAEIETRLKVPLSASQELGEQNSLDNLDRSGELNRDMTILFDLSKGWPSKGSGVFTYDVMMLKDGEKTWRTSSTFEFSFNTFFRE